MNLKCTMKKNIYILFLIINLLLGQIVFAQKIILPYREIAGVPIVKINIDNDAYNFVFDTGATQTIIDSTLSNNLQIIDSSTVIGIYGAKRQLVKVRLSGIKIDETTFKPLAVSVLNLKTLNKNICKIHLDGILGIDIMEGYFIEIDSKNQMIKFYNPKKFDKKKLNGFIKSNYWYGPLAKLKVNGKKHNVLFDTGSASVLNLAPQKKLLKYAEDHPHITAYSSGGIGLYGKDHHIAKSYKVDTLHIKFGGWFNHIFLPSSPASVNPDASIDNMGFQYIKQFHVFLDQDRKSVV